MNTDPRSTEPLLSNIEINKCVNCTNILTRFDSKYHDGFCQSCFDYKKQFGYKLGINHSIQHTPEIIARDIIKQINIKKNDIVLEPFNGDGVFLNNFPCCIKEFCEIKEGLDFFDYNKKVDWIISNPPFRVFKEEKKINAFPLIMDKSVSIARKGIAFLINWKLWNAITTHRLRKWQPFNITFIKIYDIKEWFGRYYLVIFEKDYPPIIDFSQPMVDII